MFIVLVLLLVAPVGAALAQVPAPPRWTVASEMRIDANREDLVEFWNVAIGPAGEIAVPQSQDRRVIIFDATGKRLGVAGRSGAGPGEFERSVRELGWIADTLWVGNTATLRVPIFTRTGKFVREQTMGQPPVGMRGRNAGGPVFVLQTPRVNTLGRNGAIVTVAVGEVDSGGDCPCMFAMTSAGSVLNIVGKAPPDLDPSIRHSAGSSSVPFAWRSQSDVAPDGSRAAWLFATPADRNQKRFRVVALGRRGDTVFNKTYEFTAVPVSSDTVDAAIGSRQSATEASLAAEFKRRAPPFFQPYISMGVYEGIRMGLDGTVWIGLKATSEGNPWLVLDGSGTPIARVLLPKNVLLMEASRQRIWAGETDADGLRSLVRYVVR